MVVIPPIIRESAVFLYPSVDAAKARKGQGGGSGFLVGIKSQANDSLVHLYAVTNDHVIKGSEAREILPAPVLRIPRTDGAEWIMPGEVEDWVPHRAKDDLSIRSLGAVESILYRWIDRSALVTLDHIDPDGGIGPGDEVCMVGRYVNHEMQVLDRAVVRFGNISMLPEAVWQEDRTNHQLSFLVDMRSLAGFSGSQVIVYYPVAGTPPRLDDGITHPVGVDGPREVIGNAWLLGVDWGHLPVEVATRDRYGNATGAIYVNGGMAAVVPAWKLDELLDEPEKIRPGRDKAEAEILTARETSMGGVLDALEEPALEEFAAFEELTDKLLRVPKKELDEKLAES